MKEISAWLKRPRCDLSWGSTSSSLLGLRNGILFQSNKSLSRIISKIDSRFETYPNLNPWFSSQSI